MVDPPTTTAPSRDTAPLVRELLIFVLSARGGPVVREDGHPPNSEGIDNAAHSSP